MKNVIKFGIVLAVSAMFLTGCEKDQQTIDQTKPEISCVNADNTLDARAIALEMADFLKNPETRGEVLNMLKANKHGKTLENIVADVNAKGLNSSNLGEFVKQSNQLKSTAEVHGNVQIPEAWLYEVEGASEDILVAFAPEGDESKWEKIEAYTLNKELVYLDVYDLPKKSVVVIDINGKEALKLKVKLMNKALQESGVQALPQASLKASKDAETTVVSHIKLADVHEPWIKGDAEIYAVTSGIRTSNDGKRAPQIAIVEMPYLDKKDVVYSPNQVMIFWNDYKYQAANIQLFEHDSNYNYKKLVKILVSGVFKVAGLFSNQPIIAVLGDIAAAIIEAMPDEWYQDSDDYVDSFYTLMKDKTYTNHIGAAKSATATFTPLLVPAND